MDLAVVDTDVLSFFQKTDRIKYAELAGRYQKHVQGRVIVISFMSAAELQRRSSERNWGLRRREELDEFLTVNLVRYPDLETCRIWAKIMDDGQRAGRSIDSKDAWVAASALRDGLPLISHNRKHFESIESLILLTESE
jgi:tRNA(fMet)-specific endonuclease VapC